MVICILFVLCCIGLTASPVYAIQLHMAPEGMYVHQGGHLLYILAMTGFAYAIRTSRLYVDQGWKSITAGALLLAGWNLWAFCAHIIDSLIPASHFIRDEPGLAAVILIHSPLDYLYYIFKMDHLLCVPALICMFIGLRKLTSADSSLKGAD